VVRNIQTGKNAIIEDISYEEWIRQQQGETSSAYRGNPERPVHEAIKDIQNTVAKDNTNSPFADLKPTESGYNRMKDFNDMADRLGWGTRPFGEDLARLDERTLQDVANGLDKIFQEYPELKGQLDGITLRDRSIVKGYAGVGKGESGFTLYLSEQDFSTHDRLLKNLASDHSNNWSVGKDIEGVMVHECGHMLHGLLQTPKEFRAGASERQASSQIVKNAFVSLGYREEAVVWSKLYSRIEPVGRSNSGTRFNRKSISDYAEFTDTSGREYKADNELIAESFAQIWYNGRRQNELADAVFDALMAMIGR